MNSGTVPLLYMKRFILASKSPRRKELLEKEGYYFDIMESHIEEQFQSNLSPAQNALNIARQKALDVAKKTDGVILAADTVVSIQSQLIGKPKDHRHAKKMLQMLSGQTHTVITAFVIYDTVSQKEISDTVATKVTMKKLTEKQIDDYLKLEESLDKAGAYAVQEKGDRFIAKIEGSYTNVVGLPIKEVKAALKKVL